MDVFFCKWVPGTKTDGDSHVYPKLMDVLSLVYIYTLYTYINSNTSIIPFDIEPSNQLVVDFRARRGLSYQSTQSTCEVEVFWPRIDISTTLMNQHLYHILVSPHGCQMQQGALKKNTHTSGVFFR